MTVRGPSIGLTSSSETQQTTGLGNYVMTLDQPAGFNTGWTVQIFSNTDSYNYMIGVITQADNDGSGNITVATFFSQGTLTDQSWTVQIIAGPQSSINPYPATSVDTSNFITVPTLGNIVTFNIEPNKVFTNYSTVYCSPQQDYKSWFIGTVINYDPVGGTLNVYVTNTSNTGLSYMPWTITLLDNAAIDADLIAYASDTLTPTVGSQITFTTVQSGKYFPIQGVVLIDDLTSTQNPAGTDNHYTGTIVAYSGNTLIINITSAFGTGSQSSSWGIYLVSGPQVTSLDQFQINGLEIQQDGTTSSKINISAGSVLDSTGSVVLTIPSVLSIDFTSLTSVVTVTQTGTITSSGTSVTGTGTTFTSNFGGGTSTLTDLNNQVAAIQQITINQNDLIAISGQTSRVANVLTDLSLTTNLALGAGGSSFTRGGVVNTNNTSAHALVYGIGLAYNSTTGNIVQFATSFTLSGVPDLPSGCTYYRIIGYLQIFYNGSSYTINVAQPLVTNPMYVIGDMFYFGNLFNTRLPIGSAGQTLFANGVPTWTSVSGDATFSAGGAITVTKTQGTAFGQLATLNKGASTQAVPSAPTSNGTSVMKMMGFGTQGCTLTPSSTGNVVLVFDGTYADVTSFGTRQGASIQVFQGTGTAASSGAAVTGTSLGPIVSYNSPAAEVASIGQGFSQTRLITGLALGTTSWFDLAMASASSGNTITLSSINFVAKES